MKRKFTAILLFLISIFVFSGCSCTGETVLSFSSAFSDGNNVQPGYTQTLTYKVNYQEKNDFYQKSSSINADYLSFTYGEGTYVQTLEVLSSLPALEDGKTSDISTKLSGKSVYSFKTMLTLPLSYTKGGVTTEKIDYIYSEILFCPQELSFAPIYAKTESVNTILLFGAQSADAITQETTYTTLYNLSSYQIKGVSKQITDNGVTETPIDKNVEYTFRTVIDNAALMFLIRNNVLSVNAQGSIKVVAFNYDEPKDLVFTNVSTNTLPVNFSYDGNETQSATLSKYEFSILDGNQAGMSQYYFLQEKVEGANFNSILVRYVEPLIELNSISCLGSLVYELISFETVNPSL